MPCIPWTRATPRSCRGRNTLPRYWPPSPNADWEMLAPRDIAVPHRRPQAGTRPAAQRAPGSSESVNGGASVDFGDDLVGQPVEDTVRIGWGQQHEDDVGGAGVDEGLQFPDRGLEIVVIDPHLDR